MVYIILVLYLHAYNEDLPNVKSHDPSILRGHLTQPRSKVTKRYRVKWLTYLDGLPPIKSHNPLSKWSSDKFKLYLHYYNV